MKAAPRSSARWSPHWVRRRRMPSRIEAGDSSCARSHRGRTVLRAHSSGFAAPQGQMVEVRPSSKTSSSINLRRAAASTDSSSTIAPAPPSPPGKSVPPPAPILRAGVGLPGISSEAVQAKPAAPADDPTADAADNASRKDDDHSELVWRLRHMRRSVLQEATNAASPTGDSSSPDSNGFGETTRISRSDGSPLRLASNFFSGAPLSGELNFLTTSSFDSPQQLFNGDMFARSVAYMSVGAPAGGKCGLGGKRRPVAGRYFGVGGCRHLFQPRPIPASLRRGSVVRDAALRRRQSGGPARRHRWQPECRRHVRLRHVDGFAGARRHLRRPVCPLRLPPGQRPAESARFR